MFHLSSEAAPSNKLNPNVMASDQMQIRYGAAPQPNVPIFYIKVSPKNSSPPGIYVYPSPVKGDAEQSVGIAVKHFYFLKDKSDLSYYMTEDGKGQIAELSKDNSLMLTMDEAANVINGLLLQLQRNGYTKDRVLATPLP